MSTTEKASVSPEAVKAAPVSATSAAAKTPATPQKASKAVRRTPAQTKVVSVAPAAKPLVKAAAKVAVKAPAKVVAKPQLKTKVNVEKPIKDKKPKLVRDSFTIPKAEYAVIGDLKQRAGKLSCEIKKSELIRAGIKALANLSDANLLATLKLVPTIKTGRPAKA
jgi:hypothetical protein